MDFILVEIQVYWGAVLVLILYTSQDGPDRVCQIPNKWLTLPYILHGMNFLTPHSFNFISFFGFVGQNFSIQNKQLIFMIKID